jgi:hypothetical protein
MKSHTIHLTMNVPARMDFAAQARPRQGDRGIGEYAMA